MPLFLCRWPNGDLSVVAASDKTDAVARLREHGDAEHVKLWQTPECLITFRLDDLGDFELLGFGARTANFATEKCYPELGKTICNVDRDDIHGYTPAALDQIRAAVDHERTRQEIDESKQADAKMWRELHGDTDMPSPLLDGLIRSVGMQIVHSTSDRGKIE